MKFLILCLLATAAYAKVSTNVEVAAEAIDASGESEVTMPCDFTMDFSDNDDEQQPPIIYWVKGVTVDHEDAVVIFKGFRYWNESLGEYRQFFNGYEERAEVGDLESPALTLTSLSSSDEGRYWCMIAEWSGRQQSGTDADSVALLFTTENFVDATTADSVNFDETNSGSIACSGKGSFNTVTWKKGPFHLPDSENFTHTEIGAYDTIGVRNLVNDDVSMSDKYSKMSIDSKMTLRIPNSQIEDAGRYWCQLSDTSSSNVELDTSRSSTIFSVNIPPFDCNGQSVGTYPDKADCSMYYECDGSTQTFHRSCGYDGLVYNEAEGYCDWAANVPPPCGTSQ